MALGNHLPLGEILNKIKGTPNFLLTISTSTAPQYHSQEHRMPRGTGQQVLHFGRFQRKTLLPPISAAQCEMLFNQRCPQRRCGNTGCTPQSAIRQPNLNIKFFS